MAGSAAGLKLYLNETFSELRLDSVAQWMEVGNISPQVVSWLDCLRGLSAEGVQVLLGHRESKAHQCLSVSHQFFLPSILRPGLPTSPLWPMPSGRALLRSSWWLS